MAFIYGGGMMRKKSMLLAPTITALIWLALFMQLLQGNSVLAAEESSISLDDFEAAPEGWEYVGGWEFPGAKGSVEWDTVAAYKGKGSLRLDADFSKGGAYVGIWKVLPDFKEPLSVSAWGPGTRWIAHIPYAGDFGDARFADPEEGFPFTVANGILRIEARKDGDKWRAGLLSSMDAKGNGFAQKYGYFEMRAKLPKGLGTWPAFWLLGANSLRDKSVTKIEIDAVEQYGVNPNALFTNVHLWYPDGRHWADGKPFLVTGMTDDFHRYGVMVDSDFITFYYDGVELRRVTTPEEAKVPLYLLVNLALGGGWPIDKTPDPSCMYVDYVRAYSK